MSPSVRIDEEVYRELQKRAEPFVDTPNSVLRRILDLNHGVTAHADAVVSQSPISEKEVKAVSRRGRSTRPVTRKRERSSRRVAKGHRTTAARSPNRRLTGG